MKKIARSASLRISIPGRTLSVFFGIPFARDHGGPETEPFQFLGEYRHGQFGGIMKGADNEDGMRLFFRCVEEPPQKRKKGKSKGIFSCDCFEWSSLFLGRFFLFPPSIRRVIFRWRWGRGPRVSSAWHGALS